MKSHRFRRSYRENASNLHRKIGDVLRSSDFFKHQKIYQEYPVTRINPLYSNPLHHFDWVIPSMYLVIEAHGKQHYQICDFGGEGLDKAFANLEAVQRRDDDKMHAALEGGYSYIIIPYTDEEIIDEQYLIDKVLASQNNEEYTNGMVAQSCDKQDIYKQQAREQRKQYLRSEEHKDELRRAKLLRHERYKRLKEQAR